MKTRTTTEEGPLLAQLDGPDVGEARETHSHPGETAFGCPRDFLGNRFVYAVISARARGLSIGLNMNPDKVCNFDCVYCEVQRDVPPLERELDIGVMAEELEKTLLLIQSGEIREVNGYGALNPDLLRLRNVTFSGDGEPTLCGNFAEVVQEVVHVRARGAHPYFKMVLITNGTWLDARPVQEGLRYFTRADEIWIKLDAGTQLHMNRVNRSQVPLGRVLDNIKLVGQKRPVVIQSLFPIIADQEPPPEEIDHYIQRLRELKEAGAMITLVQIYSASRPSARCTHCRHMRLQDLARISRRIKAETGLKAEVF
jgi:wyosine [tRNA(Phe)-imidazoG37] synthetase (radical SAM superfamily)